MEQGTSDTYTLVLSHQPNSTVEVSVNIPMQSPFTVSPNISTFTPQNWNTPQHITVSAFSKLPTPDNYSATIVHTPSGGGYNSAQADSVTITVKYVSPPKVIALPAKLRLNEGQSTQYNLYLSRQPSGPVTVTVNVPTKTRISTSSTQVNFTSLRWQKPVTITVTALDEGTDSQKSPITITHTAAGGGYNRAQTDSVTVNIVQVIKEPPPTLPPKPIEEEPHTPPEKTPEPPPEPPEPTEQAEPPTLPIVSIYPYPNGENYRVAEGDYFGVTVHLDTTQPHIINGIKITIHAEGDMDLIPNLEEFYVVIQPNHLTQLALLRTEDDEKTQDHATVTFKLMPDDRYPPQYIVGENSSFKTKIRNNDITVPPTYFQGTIRSLIPTATPTRTPETPATTESPTPPATQRTPANTPTPTPSPTPFIPTKRDFDPERDKAKKPNDFIPDWLPLELPERITLKLWIIIALAPAILLAAILLARRLYSNFRLWRIRRSLRKRAADNGETELPTEAP